MAAPDENPTSAAPVFDFDLAELADPRCEFVVRVVDDGETKTWLWGEVALPTTRGSEATEVLVRVLGELNWQARDLLCYEHADDIVFRLRDADVAADQRAIAHMRRLGFVERDDVVLAD